MLDGLFSGHHLNRSRGHSQDFSEHRPYNPGDDPRSLDWKIFGRTDRLVIKQYEEQTNVGAVVIVDDSASMGFSYGNRPSKLEYAKIMAAALGYLVVSQNDALGLIAGERSLPLGGQRGHLDRYFEVLEALSPAGAWNPALLSGGAAFRKKTFVIVLSDLMTQFDPLLSTLRALSARRHEVIVFQVLDPAEKDLPFEGPAVFEDMESGERLRTDTDAIRDAYRQRVDERIRSFAQAFHGFGADFLSLGTDTPFDKGLGLYLSWRASRV